MPCASGQGHTSGLIPTGNPTATQRLADAQPHTAGRQQPFQGSLDQGGHHERGAHTSPATTPHPTHRRPNAGGCTPAARGSRQSSGPNGARQTHTVCAHTRSNSPTPPPGNTCCVSFITMPYMTQMCTDLLNTPHTPPISVHRPPRHHQRALEECTPRDPRTTGTCDTQGPPTSHPRDDPTPPRSATPAEDHEHINLDTPDLNSPLRNTPPDPEQPHPLTPTSIGDPNLLQAALQGRALESSLGWYRLQDSWTQLTVKALRGLATPGRGHHEAIMIPVLWRACQHTQDQRIWIPSIEWGQALTHNTDTPKGTTHLQRALAEKDHPADPDYPEQWPPPAPPVSTPPTMTSLPHLQTETGSRRRSGVQSSNVGTTL